MANYTGRNRKRLQRDMRKGKTPRGMDWTDAHMNQYGNKRKQFVEDHIRNAGKKPNAA